MDRQEQWQAQSLAMVRAASRGYAYSVIDGGSVEEQELGERYMSRAFDLARLAGCSKATIYAAQEEGLREAGMLEAV